MKINTLLLLFLLLGNQLAYSQKPDTKVNLGIKPDYFFSGTGVHVKDVIVGKPAQIAGIKGGDVITAFDERKISDIFHYRNMLNDYTSGDKVKVTVKRNQKSLSFDVKF